MYHHFNFQFLGNTSARYFTIAWNWNTGAISWRHIWNYAVFRAPHQRSCWWEGRPAETGSCQKSCTDCTTRSKWSLMKKPQWLNLISTITYQTYHLLYDVPLKYHSCAVLKAFHNSITGMYLIVYMLFRFVLLLSYLIL